MKVRPAQALLAISLALTLFALALPLGANQERVVEEMIVHDVNEAFKIEEFARAYFDAQMDTTKAAHVKDLVLKRPTATIHLLDGYVLMQEPVQGRSYRVTYAGPGRVEVDCYNPIEKRNLKKYWGKETLEDRFTRASFRISDDEVLEIFQDLDWVDIDTVETELEAGDEEQEDETGSDDAGEKEDSWDDPVELAKKGKSLFKSYLKSVREAIENRENDPPDEKDFQRWQIGNETHTFLMEEARRAYYGPTYKGAWLVDLTRVKPKGVDAGDVYFDRVRYLESPQGGLTAKEEYGLFLHSNLGNGHDQLACAWHEPSHYDPEYLYTGTSDFIAEEDHTEIRVKEVTIEGLITDDRMDARAAISIEAQQDYVQMVALELLGNLQVKSVKWVPTDGNASAAVELPIYRPRNPSFAEIWVSDFNTILPQPIRKGERANLIVEYEGKVLEKLEVGFYAVINRLAWFPDRELSAIQLDATLWSDPKFTVTATGNPEPCEPAQESKFPGKLCRRWVVKDPPVRLATFNVASDVKIDLQEPSEDPNGLSIPIRSLAHRRQTRDFCYQDQTGKPWCKEFNLSKSTAMIKGVAAGSIMLYEDKFGYYPYKKLDLVPWENQGAAQAPPSLITLPYDAFVTQTALNEIVTAIQEQQARSQRPGRVGTPNPWTWREIISHEVSHQWWGHILYWNTQRDQWLSEGMADFSSAVFLEYDDIANDTDYALKEWGERTKLLTRRDQAGETVGPVAIGWRMNSPHNPDGFSNWYSVKVYRKGAYVAQMLRGIFRALAYQQLSDLSPQEALQKGDDLFFAMIKDFVATHRDGAVSSLMFQKTAEKHLGGNLGWFFNQWLYNDGIPKIQWAYEWVPVDKGYNLKIRVKQSNTDFQFPLTVTLRSGSGKKAEVAQFPIMVTGKDSEWSSEGRTVFPKPWDEVHINEDMMLLAEIDDPETSLSKLALK